MSKDNIKSYKTTKMISYIVLALIILVGGIFIGVFGFSKGYDVSNSYEVDVKVAESFGNSGTELATACEDFFKENKLSYVDKNVVGGGKEIVYIFDKKVDSNLMPLLEVQVIASVPESLKTTVEVSANETTASYNMSAVWYTLLIVGCAVVVGAVYIGFRYRICAALTMLCSFIVEAICYVLAISACRVPVTNTLLAVGTCGAILTSLISVLFVAKAKYLLKNKEGISYDEVSLNFANSTNLISTVTIIILLAFFIACAFLGGRLLRAFAEQLLFQGVIIILVTFGLVPTMWTAFRKIADKIGKKDTYQTTASQSKENND